MFLSKEFNKIQISYNFIIILLGKKEFLKRSVLQEKSSRRPWHSLRPLIILNDT